MLERKQTMEQTFKPMQQRAGETKGAKEKHLARDNTNTCSPGQGFLGFIYKFYTQQFDIKYFTRKPFKEKSELQFCWYFKQSVKVNFIDVKCYL